MTQTKLEKLRNLVNKAMKLEAAYVKLIGLGRLEVSICQAIFKWPDVVTALLDHISKTGEDADTCLDQAIEDTAAIILYTARPTLLSYIQQSDLPEEHKTKMLNAIARAPDNRDPDDVLEWYKAASQIATVLKAPIGMEDTNEN